VIIRFLDPILRPFRELRSKWRGIENIKHNLVGDVGRVKRMAKVAKNEAGEAVGKAKKTAGKAKDAAGKAKEAGGQAQGAYGSALGAAKGPMGAMPGMGGPPPGQAPGPGQAMAAPGMPPGMGPPPGMPPGMGPPPGMGMPPRPGQPPAMQYGAAPGGFGVPQGGVPGYGMAPPGPPQPGNRTMAIMAGGAAGAAIGWLVPLKGPHRGELITLKPQSVIGKDPACEVCINDAFLSARHATIRAQNGVFVLEDHSTNGTFVNDRKVTRHELVDSDFVKVGQTLLKFKAL
jgi:hypothetical protein